MALVLPLAASLQGPARSPYPTYGVDARHTNRSAYSGPPAAPEIAWIYEHAGGGIIEHPPSLDEEGFLYVGVRDQSGEDTRGLTAISREGFLRWTFPTFNGVSGTPAIDDQGHAYVNIGTASNGRRGLAKVDLATATELWFLPTNDSAYFSSPVIGQGGNVYFGAVDLRVRSVAPDGLLNWEHNQMRIPYCSPAIDAAGILYVAGGEAGPGLPGGFARALRSDGSVVWTRPLPDPLYGARFGPNVLDDGNIVFRGLRGEITTFDPDGNVVWEVQYPASNSDRTGALSLDGSHLYVKTGTSGVDVSLRALDVSDGSVVWSHAFAGPLVALDAPIVGADGTIYTTGPSASVWAFEPSGAVRWTKRAVPDGTPDIWAAQWPVIGFQRDLFVILATAGRLQVARLRPGGSPQAGRPSDPPRPAIR